MSKIGFFGGCFNPPTIAHLELAKKAIQDFNLNKVVFVPMSDFYEKDNLENQNHRLNMLKLLTKDEEKLDIDSFELDINKRIFAIDAFKYIDQKYDCEKYFIMGADNFSKIDTWKDSELLKNFNFIVLERRNDKNYDKKVNLVSNNKFSKISSSGVREKIKCGEEYKDFVTEDIYNYIKLNNLYLR